MKKENVVIGLEFVKAAGQGGTHLLKIFQFAGQENPLSKPLMKAVLNMAL